MNWPDFPQKNCSKLRNSWALVERALGAPPGSATGVSFIHERYDRDDTGFSHH